MKQFQFRQRKKVHKEHKFQTNGKNLTNIKCIWMIKMNWVKNKGENGSLKKLQQISSEEETPLPQFQRVITQYDTASIIGFRAQSTESPLGLMSIRKGNKHLKRRGRDEVECIPCRQGNHKIQNAGKNGAEAHFSKTWSSLGNKTWQYTAELGTHFWHIIFNLCRYRAPWLCEGSV